MVSICGSTSWWNEHWSLGTMVTDSACLSLLSHLPCLNWQTSVILYSKIPLCCKNSMWTTSSWLSSVCGSEVSRPTWIKAWAETFLMSQAELAQSSSATDRQCKFHCNTCGYAAQNGAFGSTASCTASRGSAPQPPSAGIMEIVQRDAPQRQLA